MTREIKRKTNKFSVMYNMAMTALYGWAIASWAEVLYHQAHPTHQYIFNLFEIIFG